MFNTILCIDDDPITLMLCEKVMARYNFAKIIITLQNGQEALEYLDSLKDREENSPEIIFLDLNMPIMSGWEFLDELNQNSKYSKFRNIKVVILSSTIDPHDFDKTKQYENVVHFISKPITFQELEKVEKKIIL